MRRILMLTWTTILAAVLAVACARPTPITIVVTATPSPTETPRPTETPQPTATPVPLAELDISALLVQDGDLPAGLVGAQIRDQAPQMFDEVPTADLVAYQELARSDERAGFVTVLLYESQEDLQTAYGLVVDGMVDTGEDSSDVGEQARVSSYSSGIKFAEVTYIRCHALVFVRVLDTSDTAALIAYSRRLDSRLTPLVCQE